ncbi:ATP-dependent DNA ligase [Desarmillaria tabescens]|uniref:ATP-dependent DNA ligase n=1 Tax=Armillaria tabescens TaxID=1929756 RepID=A0AA39NHA9_ARMTA|nr:ATP-dependent DNA ligase [Desarmillaria tabescens]KAK0465632.1 ATP-dependent DNA ligase [Desarmillaria tabescens]
MRTLLPHPHCLSHLYEALLKISKSKVKEPQNRGKALQKLLVSAKGEETRFLVRTLCQNLRVGAVRTSILTALARATVLTPLDSQLKFTKPEDSTWYATNALLDAAHPVAEGKSNPSRDILYAKFKNAETLIRQVTSLSRRNLNTTARGRKHAWKAVDDLVKVSIFSRHLEDMTSKNFIMDSEITAIDPSDGSLRTFQELSTRARKDVNLADVQVPMGRSYLKQTFVNDVYSCKTRFSPLDTGSKEVARFDHVERCDSVDGRPAVEAFWAKAMNSRSEGLMVKLLDTEISEHNSDKETSSNRKPLFATYNADKRTYAWMKLKKDYVMQGGVSDSLDLIPIGAWNGNGRKAKFWSPILLGMWDPSSGCPVAVCKCMSGFTDAFYKDITERRSHKKVNGKYEGRILPSAQFLYAAKGLVSSTKGLSLRFPRFIRVREDKGVSQASTPKFLADMYTDQQGRSGRKGGQMMKANLIDVDVSDSGAEEGDEGEEEEYE